MAPKTYHTYEEAAADYLTQLNALLEVPSEVKGPVTRSTGALPATVLIERADTIADVSAGMLPLAKASLHAPDADLRAGVSGQLIAQAAAELQLAAELLSITEGQAAAAGPVTRAARGTALQDAIRAVAQVMATPAAQGLATAARVTRSGAAPAATEDTKQVLRTAAIVGVDAVTERVKELGGAVAMDLVTQTEWRVALDGAALLNTDIAQKLESLKEGAGALFTQAVTAAAKTLLNVYDKIMALLGKDAEDAARKQVKEWLEQINKDKKIEVFDTLLDRLYRTSAFEKELDGWLEKTSVGPDSINGATAAVREVSAKFAVLAGRLGTVESTVVLAKKFLKFPQVMAVAAGIQVALLAVVVYTGYDYIGYRDLSFPNLAKGVAEVVKENLMPPAPK